MDVEAQAHLTLPDAEAAIQEPIPEVAKELGLLHESQGRGS